MKIERHIPAAALRPFIQAYIIVESSGNNTNKILPGTSLVMAFRLKGTTRNGLGHDELPGTAVAGLTRSPRLVEYAAQTTTVLTIFREAGAAAFFTPPLHELFGQHVPLDNLLNRQKIARLEDALADAANNTQRIAILEKFFRSSLHGRQPDMRIQTAMQNIRQVNGNIRIKDLAASLNTSLDVFEKKFRGVVGTSPKHFSSLVRLGNAVRNFSKDRSLTDIAYASGFFDQSHFIREFKLFTGQAPRAFFAEQPASEDQ